MTVSLIIRRTGVLLIVGLGALALVGSAQSGTEQGVPRQAAIDAASANWAAKAKLLGINGQPRLDTFAPTSAVQAASANWAAKAKLLDETGQPFRTTVVSSQPGSGFDWGDFGIGAVAMLGLLLVGVGVISGAQLKAGYFAGLVPTRLGSQDLRDTARAASGAAKAAKR